jgi:hypothetical protein
MKRKRTETITIKATPAALSNFRQAAALSGDKQYKVIEEASKDVLEKISTQIRSTRKTS